MKACTKCGSTENGFYASKEGRDGLKSWCKVCCRDNLRAWHSRNPGKQHEYYIAHVDERRAYGRSYGRDYRARNSDANRARSCKYYAANIERKIAYSRQWQRDNPERVNAKNARWRKRNRGKCNAKLARRRAATLRATPPWVDHTAIRVIYEAAARLTCETGIPHDVDHIVPLMGKLVCGLHVPWNLRVITAAANRRKGNRS